ncbi:substrate-binding periplasmic protein [Undibacterium fentianense]|uniref:Transporter substrate-binding domain-containing protein n=1 Tax=Undibacterium fentianense TaxID=2828728 RepID=A0A941DXI5_9BURK|nr:transporter substrate-binding domain-containing protein [Undibacterium fentianense]MBR7799254.1 transporter substrate-binding domain-containing protein [Undibacterium fentianense]
MRKTKYLSQQLSRAALLLLSAISGAGTAQTKHTTIQVTTEYLFPLNIVDKEGEAIYGQSADKVHELFKRSRLPYQMNMMSWNRAFELARKNPDTCVFSTARIKERESWFQWVGPIASGHWAVFGSPEKLGKVTRLEDIQHATIGTEIGNVSVPYLSERGFHMITSSESETTFKNVAVGRIDYATAGDIHGKKIIAEHHLEDKVIWLFNYQTSDYYLACNPKMNSNTIALLNAKLREMKQDGSYKNIDAKY